MDDSEPAETSAVVVNNDEKSEPKEVVATKTLLPSPIASLVSLITSTSAFGFRLGGYIGGAALRGARIGTLTGFELGRVVLEGILSRAGQDVITSSSGAIGQAAAETLLERALTSLHLAITTGSFLASTGFQVGSTSLTSGVAIVQYFLSALDAIFGDTESSKAIATIIVLVQKESRNPETGAKGERLTLADFIVGSVAFGLLQRWGRERTSEEFIETGGEQVVWDVVVINQGRRLPSLPALESTTSNLNGLSGEQEEDAEADRPASSVSPAGDVPMFDAYTADDGMSFISRTSSRPVSAGNEHGRPEQAFRNHLMDQLRPGSQIRITSQSVTTNSVTVEVIGDSAMDIQPPAGYSLISSESLGAADPNSRKFIFSNRQRRQRRGSFEVDEMGQLRRPGPPSPPTQDALPSFQFPPIEPGQVGQSSHPSESPSPKSKGNIRNSPQTEPVAANQKKTRVPLQADSSSSLTLVPPFDFRKSQNKQKKSSFRNTLRRGTSYKNLVDFWRDRDRYPKSDETSDISTSNIGSLPSYPVTPSLDDAYNAAAFAHSHLQRSNFENSSSFVNHPDRLDRRHSHHKHKRGNSSIYTMTATTSETSLVLHDSPDIADGERVVNVLQRDGILPEIYPCAPLARNLARFSRFAAAAYGEKFLRLTGAINGETPESTSPDDRLVVSEHRSFSSYINLPSSTVLLSSYVDPQGGTDATGETETGMPLIHYVSVDHESKAVVITCRGTLGFEDVLTDMTCDYANLQWRGREYPVHKGMLASARRLLTLHGGRMILTAKTSLEEFPDYGVVICGHSLGGGVAALLGILLSQPVLSGMSGATAFVTTSIPTQKLIQAAASAHEAPANTSFAPVTLPPNRPIHVYAFGPAACMSAELQQATRGLITTVCNGLDLVPYLSLGNLRDQQAICLAFKTDTGDAKGEIKKRVWEGFLDTVKDKTRTRNFFASDWLEADEQTNIDQDQWPWAALKSLRASMTAEKLVPPGEVYIVQAQAVLQRQAFVEQNPNGGAVTPDVSTRTFKPATHITFSHVRDVAKRFGEIRIGASMFSDHFPGRYDRVLRLLAQGVDI